MINNTTASSVTPSQTIINNPPTSSNNNSILNDMVKIQNQHAELINLPNELKQKIAFNLDGVSYSNLRLTAKEMYNAIPSFPAIISQLKERRSGEVQDKYITMYRNSVTQLIANEVKDDVIQCLKYASVDKRYVNSDSTTIYTKFHPGKDTPHVHWNGNILERCKNEIIKSSNNRLTPNVITMQFREPFSSIERKFVTLDIKDQDINYLNLSIIFNAFNKILNEERSSDRFLIALSALQLKNYLYQNPPKGITRNEILRSESHYPFLFTMGAIVAGYVSKTYVRNN